MRFTFEDFVSDKAYLTSTARTTAVRRLLHPPHQGATDRHDDHGYLNEPSSIGDHIVEKVGLKDWYRRGGVGRERGDGEQGQTTQAEQEKHQPAKAAGTEHVHGTRS